MVAAAVLKTVGEIRVGSSPTIDTTFRGYSSVVRAGVS